MTLCCVNLAEPEISLPEFPSLCGSEFCLATREICIRPEMQKWGAAIIILWRSSKRPSNITVHARWCWSAGSSCQRREQPGPWFLQPQPDCSFSICKSLARNMWKVPAYSASHPSDQGWKPRKAPPGSFILMGSGFPSQVPIFLKNSSLSSCVHLALASPTSCLSFHPNLVILDNKDFLSHSFCKSRTWKWFIWLLWLMAFHSRC